MEKTFRFQKVLLYISLVIWTLIFVSFLFLTTTGDDSSMRINGELPTTESKRMILIVFSSFYIFAMSMSIGYIKLAPRGVVKLKAMYGN